MLHNVFARLLDSTSLPTQRTSSSTTIITALHRNKNNRTESKQEQHTESKQEQPHRIETRTTGPHRDKNNRTTTAPHRNKNIHIATKQE
jgi:hypothetical protein